MILATAQSCVGNCGNLKDATHLSSLQQFPLGLDHCYDRLGLAMVPPYNISEHLMQSRVLEDS